MMKDFDRYDQGLRQIYDYLIGWCDHRWAPIIAGWLDVLSPDMSPMLLLAHVKRSMKATGGMGSLGDLSISPGNGHQIENDRVAIGEASEKLWKLTAKLFQAADTIRARLE